MKCHGCGKSIPKRTHTFYIREPQAAFKAAPPFGYQDTPEKPDGYRDQSSPFYTTLYLANPPKTKAECQPLTNGQVVNVRYGKRGIVSFSSWDGVSYTAEYFCSNKCAIRLGTTMAAKGWRITRE